MKSMRKSAKGRGWWKYSSYVGLCLLLLLVFHPKAGGAEDVEIVEPHRYEQGQVRLNLQYFRESELYRRGAISEEQRLLTFLPSEYRLFEQVGEQLFSGGTNDNNTVIAKAEQLQLFQTAEQGTNQTYRNDREGEQSPLSLTTVLLSIVFLLVGILFVMILPRLAQRSS